MSSTTLRRLGLIGVIALLGLSVPGCSDAPCEAPDVSALDLDTVRARFRKLSGFCQVSAPAVPGSGQPELLPRVEPYQPATPLFSDYAVKQRTIWMPRGTSADYRDPEVLDFPLGTILSKSFMFPADLRRPDENIRLVETRLMLRTTNGWLGLPYTWNEDQQDAELNLSGDVVPQHPTGLDGSPLSANYLIPAQTQCGACHKSGEIKPIGPTARQLNRDYLYPTGTENQLEHLSRVGYLQGAPPPATAPRLSAFDDPSSGTVEQRARGWLEANCAHCHSESGMASNTGLFLSTLETDPRRLGFCKTPVAAGPAAGGRPYDITPGDPEQSILMFRLEATDSALAMPPLGRSVVQRESVELVRQWIASLPGSCVQ